MKYLSITIIKDNFFDEFFYQADSKEEALAVFGEIYSAAFCMFDKFWTKRTDTSIMRFNTIIVIIVNNCKLELYVAFSLSSLLS